MIIHQRSLRDRKIAQLKQGKNAYAESKELIRLIKRDIEKEHLNVLCEETNNGCWFIPLDERKTS
ncbi:hypothetical protein GCM10010978_15860 [Compostibacillus humi]|uniref:Uncharacterized protein n=1 Tax=Compostibacillus humi TaxID=1245525 RepID=A0A8J3EJZ6_9BACI|nr:hypothetical protein [Compostibacillus humi]GGH75723.1 hypothetical protein GCM10010978_15860 [Compostibacillus humi]HLT55763.1 hypothetical protein [Bacillota bacterium]